MIQESQRMQFWHGGLGAQVLISRKQGGLGEEKQSQKEDVREVAFGGPEQRLSHSRLSMSWVLPAFLKNSLASLCAEAGKASSSILDSIDPMTGGRESSSCVCQVLLSVRPSRPKRSESESKDLVSWLKPFSVCFALSTDCSHRDAEGG